MHQVLIDAHQMLGPEWRAFVIKALPTTPEELSGWERDFPPMSGNKARRLRDMLPTLAGLVPQPHDHFDLSAKWLSLLGTPAP